MMPYEITPKMLLRIQDPQIRRIMSNLEAFRKRNKLTLHDALREFYIYVSERKRLDEMENR